MRNYLIQFMKELREKIKNEENILGFKILYGSEDNGYFTVEDSEGYRAYAQINSFNMGIDVSVCYKPQPKKGSGKNIAESIPADNDRVIDTLKTALSSARYYPKDERQPKDEYSSYL